MKVFSNCGYEGLLHTLQDPRNKTYWDDLAPNFRSKMPEISTFSERFGDPDLTGPLFDILAAQGKKGRKIDYLTLVDSDQLPTIPSMNSRTLKFGGPPPSWRIYADMIKRHFAMGNVSNLIVAMDVTLDEGIGTSDGCHLPSVLFKAMLVKAAPTPSPRTKRTRSAGISNGAKSWESNSPTSGNARTRSASRHAKSGANWRATWRSWKTRTNASSTRYTVTAVKAKAIRHGRSITIRSHGCGRERMIRRRNIRGI